MGKMYIIICVCEHYSLLIIFVIVLIACMQGKENAKYLLKSQQLSTYTLYLWGLGWKKGGLIFSSEFYQADDDD